MKPCISQVTTLNNPFEADLTVYRGGGWTAVELWLTKLETFLEAHSLGGGPCDARVETGVTPGRGGFAGRACCSRKARSAQSTGTTSAGGWNCCGELGVPTLIVAPDFARRPWPDDYGRAADGAGRSRRAGCVDSACGSPSSFRSRRRSVPVWRRPWP